MKYLKYSALCALMLTAPLSVATAEEGVTDTEIVIGNVLPMTSSAALVGRAAHFGSIVAAAEANANGGVNNRSVTIKTEDDGYVPARTVQGLRKLMDQGVFGLIGTGAGAGTTAILPILEDEGIPAIVSFSPVQAAVDPIKPTVFMIGASYQDLLFAQLKYIHDNDSPDTAKYGVIRQDDDFGKQVEEAFTRAVETFGADHADPIRFKRGQKDFSAEILRIRSDKVNVLIAGGVTTEIPTMLKESRKFNLDLRVATVPTSTLPPIMGLSVPAGYTYYSGDYISPMGSEGTAHFTKTANAHLNEGELKALNRYALTGYVATRIMIEAIRRCGAEPTRACAVEKMESGEPFETAGITLPLTFAPDRHISATAVRVLKVDPKAGSVTPVTEFTQY